MPLSSAICDIVTDSNPCSPTSAVAVSRIASWTSRRCSFSVSFQSFGTGLVYGSLLVDTYRFDRDSVSRSGWGGRLTTSTGGDTHDGANGERPRRRGRGPIEQPDA